MSAPYNNIMRRLEDALRDYILANDPPDATTSIYSSMDSAAVNDTVHMPCYVIYGRSSRPVLPEQPESDYVNTRIVTLVIECRSQADDELDDGNIVVKTAREIHDTIVGRLLDLVTTGQLAAALTVHGAGYGVAVDQCDQFAEEFRVDGQQRFVTEITIDMMARSVAT